MRNKLGLFVLLIVGVILISGCTTNISIGDGQDQKKSGECIFSSECESGFHCFNSEKCVSNEILENKEDCEIINKPPAYSKYCIQKCENCEDGNFTCWGGSTDLPDIKNKCVECTGDRDCKSGFECDEWNCVGVGGTCAELGGVACPPAGGVVACMNGKIIKAADTDYCCTGSCG